MGSGGVMTQAARVYGPLTPEQSCHFVRTTDMRGAAMGTVRQTDQDHLLEVLERHKNELRSTGAHYIDVGYKIVDGVPTDQLAVRIHVNRKLSEVQLEGSPVTIAPKDVEGIPVDVIQSNPKLQQNARDGRFNPVLGGVAVRNVRFPYFGTLGLMVFDSDSGAPMGLSNWHVLVDPDGAKRDPVTQPGTTNSGDVIGSLTRWDKELDCAVFTLNGSRSITTGVVDSAPGATSLDEPLIGTNVAKSGRTTGTTFGIIDGVTAQELTIIPDPDRPAPNGEISDSGDSGSVWLRTADSAALGLHYAGESSTDPADERAWAKRITNVAQALNFTLR